MALRPDEGRDSNDSSTVDADARHGRNGWHDGHDDGYVDSLHPGRNRSRAADCLSAQVDPKMTTNDVVLPHVSRGARLRDRQQRRRRALGSGTGIITDVEVEGVDPVGRRLRNHLVDVTRQGCAGRPIEDIRRRLRCRQ